MSLFQRIRGEEQKEKKIKDDAEASIKKNKEMITQAQLECKKIIPTVESFLQKTCNEFDLILERAPNIASWVIYGFNVYVSQKKFGFIKQKSHEIFCVYIGSARVNKQTWEGKVIPIEIAYYGSQYNVETGRHDGYSCIVAGYDKPATGFNAQEITKWLEDTFYEKRKELKLSTPK